MVFCLVAKKFFTLPTFFFFTLFVNNFRKKNQKNKQTNKQTKKKKQPNKKKTKKTKKNSENANTSRPVTFHLDVWPWPYYKVKKVYVIRCRFLLCALVPGMISVNVIVCEILPLIHFCVLWPTPMTFSLCQGHSHSNQ